MTVNKTDNKEYPKIDDEQLDNILRIITYSKYSGFRNSKEIHVRCKRAEEFDTFYMYFIRNIKRNYNNIKLLNYRNFVCISKKNPNTLYIYVILKHSGFYCSSSINIIELLNYIGEDLEESKQKFKNDIENLISKIILEINNKLRYESMSTDIRLLCKQFEVFDIEDIRKTRLYDII